MSIEKSKIFYEKLGLKFIREEYGKGSVHYSTYIGELLIELYLLGFSLDVEDIYKHMKKVNIKIDSE